VIKRIRFATRAPGEPAAAFATAWTDAVAAAVRAPLAARPVRVAACTSLPDLSGPEPRHDGIGIEWFTDVEHLRRFRRWLDGADASPVVVAVESVMRGADWLERRWRVGGERLKHMAVARRAAGLSPAEFAERWRAHAGQAGTTAIPDPAKGRAYVQNRPCPRTDGEWPYDAVNEVWFDDLDGLRTRIDWFRDNLDPRRPDDLFGQSWFLAVREVVLPD
jgi:hypothetical protein